jgi:hypothetical protein
MSIPTPLYHVPVIIVTAEDGTLFTCTVCQPANSLDASDRFWLLMDQQGGEFTGPMYVRREHPVDTQRRVAEWWDAYKAAPSAVTGPRGN